MAWQYKCQFGSSKFGYIVGTITNFDFDPSGERIAMIDSDGWCYSFDVNTNCKNLYMQAHTVPKSN